MVERNPTFSSTRSPRSLGPAHRYAAVRPVRRSVMPLDVRSVRSALMIFLRFANSAHLALMGPLAVVVRDPHVEVRLKFVECRVELLGEGDLIELLSRS